MGRAEPTIGAVGGGCAAVPEPGEGGVHVEKSLNGFRPIAPVDEARGLGPALGGGSGEKVGTHAAAPSAATAIATRHAPRRRQPDSKQGEVAIDPRN
jgi:hypothetical protein